MLRADDLSPVQRTHRHAARRAGLVYASDDSPGIRREGSAGNFRYIDARGRALRNAKTLARILSLAIPPAWEGVWIAPSANAHIQAVGRDARGRKQYRYHSRWREARDETKFDRMASFAKALPSLRRKIARDLRKKGMPREKVLAAVVKLLETSLIRVGNDEYASSNRSYGLTTMHNKHARVRGGKTVFDFVGKSGKRHVVELDDPRLAKIVRTCQDLPGQELFCYKDESGGVRDVTSGDVNGYLREIAGEEFTAKDFRTWAGTVLAAVALREFAEFESGSEAKRNVARAIEAVAKMLGNTPAVCRKCYIHPAVLECYLEGQTIATLRQTADRSVARSLSRLKPEEAAVLMLMREKLADAESRKVPQKSAQLGRGKLVPAKSGNRRARENSRSRRAKK